MKLVPYHAFACEEACVVLKRCSALSCLILESGSRSGDKVGDNGDNTQRPRPCSSNPPESPRSDSLIPALMEWL
ncbi:unnamed protein product [Lota lota]